MAKVNWNLDYDEMEAVCVGDATFNVRKRIPYEEKVDMIGEYVNVAMITEDDGYAGENPYGFMFWFYLTLKYYTDVELSKADNIGWIYDWAIDTGAYEIIRSVCGKDLDETGTFSDNMMSALKKQWKQSHSLTASLAQMNGEKALEAIAEMRPMNEELIDLLHMREQAQESQNMVVLSEFAKKDKK